MEDKLTQTANPDAVASQATSEATPQAPTATAEQGIHAASVNPDDTPQTLTDAEQSTESEADSQASAEDTATNLSNAISDDPVAKSDSDPALEDTVQQAETTETSESGVAQASDTTESPSDAGASASKDTNDSMTMEDVLAASDEQLARPPIHRGMIIKGSIIMLAQDGIVIDVGAKIEGLLPYNQVFEFDTNVEEAAKYFKSGDELQVYVVRADIPNNTIVLSKKRADQERAWNLLQEIHEKKLPVEVEIIEKVRGGLVANLGVRAFLPASQIDIRRISDLSPYVSQRLRVKIIELNRKRNRVIVSRRAVLEEELAGVKEETLKKLEPGFQTEGEVVEITDFGVFVNLGGVDGLIHRSELTHGRFNHPKDVVKVGQKVKVEVLDMDLERERINLSMKKLSSDPWSDALFKYSIGQRIAGKVTNLTPFGAFIEIEAGLEGLVHVSEMSWTKRIRHPKEVLKEGEDVEAMILKIDGDNQRISLGLRQTQPDPWSSLPDRYPPGTEVSGPITGITEFGVFMEIEEGIEGLVHISELAHEHIETITDHFNKGDEISAVILNIDPVEQRASLSRKRLLPYAGPSQDDRDAYSGAAGAQRGRDAGRKGRRGGRRSQVIDYDYSYASAEGSSRTTTKLGDVYADLFAQFGLSEVASPASKKPEAEKKPKPEVKPESKADTPKAVDSPATSDAQTEDTIDPENAIDAAEAAALLTAAFREGKRPVTSETKETAVVEESSATVAEDRSEDSISDDSISDEAAPDADELALEEVMKDETAKDETA